MKKGICFVGIMIVLLSFGLTLSQAQVKEHIVKAKQTWADLAVIYGVPMDEIAAANGRTIKNTLYRGEGVKIPVKEVVQEAPKRKDTIKQPPLLKQVDQPLEKTFLEPIEKEQKEPNQFLLSIGLAFALMIILIILFLATRKKTENKLPSTLNHRKQDEITIQLKNNQINYEIPCGIENDYFVCPVPDCKDRKKSFQKMKQHLKKDHLPKQELEHFRSCAAT